MQLNPSDRNSGSARGGDSEIFPQVEMPHGVSMVVQEIGRSVSSSWFGLNLDRVYKAHIRTVLPIQEDFPAGSPPGLFASPSEYWPRVQCALKEALAEAQDSPPDVSARLRRFFGIREELHHHAELASVAVDFVQRLRRHGNLSEASEIATGALRIAQKHRYPFLHARVHYEVGAILDSTGQYEQAAAHFSAMLKSAGPLLENHGDCMQWALGRIPRVIDRIFTHSFPQHDDEAKALLSHSYLLLKTLLENRRFIAACCVSAVVSPAQVAAARAAGFLGSQSDCELYATRACVSAASNNDPMLACATAVELARVFQERKKSETGLRIVMNAIDSIEPRLSSKHGRPNVELVKRFGDVLDAAADLHLDLGDPGKSVAMMSRKEELFKKFKLGLPDDGNEPEPEFA